MDEIIAGRLRDCTSLPGIPDVARRLIELANQPETGMAQICDCVSMDPELSAKFLRMARSPHYPTRRNAANLRQAISLLGAHASIRIALSLSLVQSGQWTSAVRTIDPAQFWQRAMLSALASRALGERSHLKKLDDLFLAGLLQDIGILVFDAMMPDEYQRICGKWQTHDELLTAELDAFGAGHDEVGYWLLKRWNMPDYLALSCLGSHRLKREMEAMSKMSACIAVSGMIADHFLDPNNKETLTALVDAAQQYLDMDSGTLAGVLDIVAARLPETAELFGVNLLGTIKINALVPEARDLQMLRRLGQSRGPERNSMRDALTGAANRSFLDSVLHSEFELATRHGWPLSVAMIGLDHFEKLGDSPGQPAGDSVLLSVAHRIQGQIRPDDIFARYGSKEFIVVLPGTPLEQMLALLMRLKESIGALGRGHEKGAFMDVTASIGVASHMDSGVRFERKDELLKAVGEARDRARRAGRNHLEIWRGHQRGVHDG